MINKLKPCPFCGADGAVSTTYTDDLSTMYWYCFCTCDCVESRLYNTEKEAIEAWNRRTERKEEG